MNRIPIALGVLLLGSSLGLACSSGGDGGGPSLSLVKATPSNNQQSATVTSTLPNPVRVLLTENGSPKQGSTVTWLVTTGGPNAAIVPLSATTDANGVAEATWTLGETAGAQTVHASASGATGSPQTFSATAQADVAVNFGHTAANDGDNQTGQVNTDLPNPLRVIVTDQFGNGVQGEDVDWLVTVAPGTGTDVNPAASQTNASGIATTTLTLGDALGDVTVSATWTGDPQSPETFAATIIAGPPPPPNSIAVTVGPGIIFTSNRNGTSNPAVDTVAVNGTVTWTWSGTLPHSVESQGNPSFTSSATLTGAGNNYQFTFPNAGTYQYDCAVHGVGMTGRIVVR